MTVGPAMWESAGQRATRRRAATAQVESAADRCPQPAHLRESTARSQAVVWFQLAKMRLTIRLAFAHACAYCHAEPTSCEDSPLRRCQFADRAIPVDPALNGVPSNLPASAGSYTFSLQPKTLRYGDVPLSAASGIVPDGGIPGSYTSVSSRRRHRSPTTGRTLSC